MPDVAAAVVDVCGNDLEVVLADRLCAGLCPAVEREDGDESGDRRDGGDDEEREDCEPALVSGGHVRWEAQSGLLSGEAGSSTITVPPCPPWNVQTK